MDSAQLLEASSDEAARGEESAASDPSVAVHPRITFVNQHYAPDVASTGQHLADLAEYLAEHGWDVEVLTARGAYRSGRLDAPARERRNDVAVRRLWTPGLGRGRHVGRLLDYACFGAQALMRLLAGRSPDGVVFLTTPPLLPALGLIVRSLRGTPYGVWSMDLHPEAEIAHGMLSADGLLARLLLKVTNLGYRGADFIVVLGSCMRRRLEDRGIDGTKLTEIPVWSRADEVHPVPRSENPLAQELGLDGHFVVGYSGNAGIAHDFGPILEAMKAMKGDAGTEFLFIGGGPRRPEIEAFVAANGITNFRYVDYFPRDQLAFSLSLPDVHLVTLRPEFEGIAVPGKLYGIMAAGRPLIFVGPRSSAIAETVSAHKCGVVVDPARDNDSVSAVARGLQHLRTNPDVRRTMGTRGRQALVRSFERNSCGARFEQLLNRNWRGHSKKTPPPQLVWRRFFRDRLIDSQSAPRALAGTLGANALLLCAGLLTGVLAARLLHPSGRGLLATVLFWPQLLASLGFLSLNEAISFRIGERPERARITAGTGILLASALALLVGVVTAVLVPWLLGEARREVWPLARIYAVAYALLSLPVLVPMASDHGRLRFARYNLFRVMPAVGYIVGIIALWSTGRVSVPWFVGANAVALGVAAAIRLRGRDIWQAAGATWTEAKRILAVGAKFHGVTVLLVLSVQIDRLVALRIFSDRTIGYYMVAYALASVGLRAVGVAFHTVLFPRLAQEGERANRAAVLVRGLRMATLLLIPIALVIAALGPWLVIILFGSEFAPAGSLAALLTLAFLLYTFREIVVRGLRGAGEARAGMVAEGVGIVSFLGLVFPAVSRFGVHGLAGALLLGNIPPLIVLIVHLRRRYGIAPRSLWGLTPRTAREMVTVGRQTVFAGRPAA